MALRWTEPVAIAVAFRDTSISAYRPIATRGWPARGRIRTLPRPSLTADWSASTHGLGSTFPTAIFTAWLHPHVTCSQMRPGKESHEDANCRQGTSHCNANARFSSADQPVALIANFQHRATLHRQGAATLQIAQAAPRTLASQGSQFWPPTQQKVCKNGRQDTANSISQRQIDITLHLYFCFCSSRELRESAESDNPSYQVIQKQRSCFCICFLPGLSGDILVDLAASIVGPIIGFGVLRSATSTTTHRPANQENNCYQLKHTRGTDMKTR